MMAFIEQEANEKAEEIDAKVGNCNLCYSLCYNLLHSSGLTLLYKYINIFDWPFVLNKIYENIYNILQERVISY